MCFVNDDADWTAQVYETKEVADVARAFCEECNGRIEKQPGIRIWMQEYEFCRQSSPHDCITDPEDCDVGETAVLWLCMTCHKLRQVIEQVETERGCPEGSRVPLIGELYDQLLEIDYDNLAAYLAAAEAYPGLKQAILTGPFGHCFASGPEE